MAEIIKWWKNKNAVLIICTGVLSVVIAFLFAYFISWGWILSLVIAVAGGITMRIFINKLIDEFASKNEDIKKTT
jgi:hypothetical protein